ncbi:MAG: type II toxin-antitoxin system VapC family toxin [Gemmatimonadetes bacterium]|nr:type II toxin-antitoxin system VapC family toxin [Gemmatimonadota bacterium]
MIVPDTNLLLYAVDASSAHHERSRRWLDATIGGVEPVGFAWVVLLGFVRISTNPRILEQPLPLHDALGVVNLWLAQPVASVVEPGERHWAILQGLLREAGRGGNLTTDAHLAALCIERGATLASADGDFTRFRGLRFLNPLR